MSVLEVCVRMHVEWSVREYGSCLCRDVGLVIPN